MENCSHISVVSKRVSPAVMLMKDVLSNKKNYTSAVAQKIRSLNQEYHLKRYCGYVML